MHVVLAIVGAFYAADGYAETSPDQFRWIWVSAQSEEVGELELWFIFKNHNLFESRLNPSVVVLAEKAETDKILRCQKLD